MFMSRADLAKHLICVCTGDMFMFWGALSSVLSFISIASVTSCSLMLSREYRN